MPRTLTRISEIINSKNILIKLKELGNTTISAHSQRFFKTGKGEYAEGDIFLGIRVPIIRKCVRQYSEISLEDTLILLQSSFHEVRLFSLLMLVKKFMSARTDSLRKNIYSEYLRSTVFINNWDLVDCSAEHIVGGYLFNKDRAPLYRLAQSESLWERRIAVMSTFYFIKRDEFDDTLRLAAMLLSDKEDLIHKAVGWMLREIGKRDRKAETCFLDCYSSKMPRTMLRYAIEKFPEAQRRLFLCS